MEDQHTQTSRSTAPDAEEISEQNVIPDQPPDLEQPALTSRWELPPLGEVPPFPEMSLHLELPRVTNILEEFPRLELHPSISEMLRPVESVPELPPLRPTFVDWLEHQVQPLRLPPPLRRPESLPSLPSFADLLEHQEQPPSFLPFLRRPESPLESPPTLFPVEESPPSPESSTPSDPQEILRAWEVRSVIEPWSSLQTRGTQEDEGQGPSGSTRRPMSTTEEKEPLDTLKCQLQNRLECLMCIEIMVSPIMLCCNGHMICDSCRPNLKRCHLCR